MIVPDRNVKGGIASVVNGYREYDFGSGYEITYVESYCNGSRRKKLRKALGGYLAFLKVIFGNRPDLVHIHSSFGPSFYRKMPFIYLARLKKIPVVNHIHGAEFDAFYSDASSRKQKLIRKVYDKCQLLIALSNEWRENLEKIVRPEKIAVLENYCRIPDFQAGPKKTQILFLGELGKRKGCFDIPEICRKAAEKGGHAPVIMAGDGELAEVKKAFEVCRLSESVSFPGWVRGEEKEKLLRESGIFLFPSYFEGMPVVILEAMAYKMAIVTTNVGGIPELIEDGVSGFLCEPGDVDGLSDRLSEILLDEKKRKRLGEAAYRRAVDNYGMDSHIERLLGLYRQALEGKSRREK